MTEESWSRGDWMQTYTGRQFYPLDPRPEDVDERDIAHSLAMQCRYGGHVDRFYSVAEHCVLMAGTFKDPTLALWALLHDATEAYVVDVPRPVKRNLVGYREIEDRVMDAIAARFGLVGDIPAEVHDADNRILLTERDALMKPAAAPWAVEHLGALPVEIHAWPSNLAELHYREALRNLTAAVGRAS